MKSKIILVLNLSLLFGNALAQQPDLLPPVQTDPVELTPLNIILYFVMPVVIFIIHYLYRKSKKKN
jgi:hypothetical protein